MFLDTSGLMCLFDSEDPRHLNATNHYNSTTRLITHNYVLAEFVALALARRSPRIESIQYVNSICHSNEIDVVWVDTDLHDRAIRFLLQRQDKKWSLCDAVSFVLMSEHGESVALTTDHHFEQAGFVRLLD